MVQWIVSSHNLLHLVNRVLGWVVVRDTLLNPMLYPLFCNLHMTWFTDGAMDCPLPQPPSSCQSHVGVGGSQGNPIKPYVVPIVLLLTYDLVY